MILKKVEGRRNPRAWHGSRLTVSGLHGHPSTPNPRPKRRVETPGDPWGVSQPPGPSSPAYGTPPTANRWFLPLSSSQWGQTLPTTSVMFPVRIEPRGHAQGGKKIPGICGNCGGERHCSDDRNCKNTAKCVNCNGNHPVFSRDCPTWKKEKAILKVKYEKSITFPEARKLVEEQFAAPGKTYASITKVAGVHVSCTDAQTQTDETCIAELKSATSNAGSKPTLAPPLSGMAQIKMGVVPSTSTQPNPAETKSTPKPAETKSAPNAKDKVDTGRTAKGSDDPIKTHNRYGAFNEDDMETEVTPSSPRRSIITRIPTT